MPSAKVLEAKKAIVAELVERINNSVTGVLVSYKGISVADDTALRKELREAGVKYTVVKNTLLSRACEETNLTGLQGTLEGGGYNHRYNLSDLCPKARWKARWF